MWGLDWAEESGRRPGEPGVPSLVFKVQMSGGKSGEAKQVLAEEWLPDQRASIRLLYRVVLFRENDWISKQVRLALSGIGNGGANER